MKIIWCMVPEICSMWQTDFFVILDCFLHFYPRKDQKNKIFEKILKNPGDIIILHICTTTDNHIMYGSWYIKCNRQNFLLLWTVFCPFTPLTTKKSKFWKTEKSPWNYHYFTQVYQKSCHMLCCSLDMARNGFKGHLHYKIITSQNVSYKAQVMNFFIS